MRNISIFSLVLILSIFIIFPAFSQTESITITTYYPAPFGVYNNLRLFPSAQPATCDEGNMYYDRNTHQVMVCGQNAAGTLSWQGVGLWTRNGNDIYPDDPNWNVGIGTDNPQAILDVNSATSGLLLPRTTRANVTNPVNGMMIYNVGTGAIDYYHNGWATFGGDFGGAYSCYLCEWISFYKGLGIDVSSWYVVNPYTGGMSCPAGYHSQQLMPPVLVGGSANIFNVIVCWK